ncbi:MAG: 5-formyltetrahydrofolate cyclo-ligase [bacterium]
MDKNTHRQAFRSKRDSLSKKAINTLSLAVFNNFISCFSGLLPNARKVMLYIDTQSEVSTSPFIEFFLNNGIKVYAPSVSSGKIRPVLLHKNCILKEASFKIKEPHPKIHIANVEKLDMVIVPGIAFDLTGHRLGFGRGYYDKFLKQVSKKTIKIGLAFSQQVVASLPAEKHDIKMDYIITDKNIISQKVPI